MHSLSELSQLSLDELNEKIANELKIREIQVPDSFNKQKVLTDILIENKKLSTKAANDLLEQVTGCSSINPELISFSQQFLERVGTLISKDFVLNAKVLPIKHEGKFIHLIMANPFDESVIHELEVITGSQIKVYCCYSSGIETVTRSSYPNMTSLEQEDFDLIVRQAVYSTNAYFNARSQDIMQLVNQPSVITLFRLMLQITVGQGISDVHFEPQKEEFRIRVRQDGVLRVTWKLPRILEHAIINRIKLLTDLSLERSQAPLDGRIGANLVKGRQMDIRVSVLPGIYGEKVVMRLLDKGKDQLALDDLRLDKVADQRIRYAIAQPSGMFLVTGPTGSGKTTTLYSILSYLNTEGVNISTAEDPVEYDLAGITQVSCTKNDNIAFSQALKSFLRQDPDIIMVGEIRDLETADIAVKAALTGHLLLSTLHTNDAASTIMRLINIGVPPYLLAACRLTIVAQRLMRKVCNHCKTNYELTRKEKLAFNDLLQHIPAFYIGKGCDNCAGTGYKGRLAILEVLTVDEEIEKMIIAEQTVSEIRKTAIDNGMQSLRESAIEKLQQQLTTIEEVLRVTVEA